MPVIDLSIILPVHNAETQIEQCLESILFSGYPVNTELVIIDDASVDDSFKIIQRFVSAHRSDFTNILLERNKQNLGVAASRNLGLNISSGEYVYFIDADDSVVSNGISTLYNLAVASGADMVIGSHETYTTYDNNIGIHSLYDFDIVSPFDQDVLCDMFYVGQIGNNVWNKIYRKDICSRFSITEYYEDYPFVLNTMMNCNRIVHIDKITYRYTKQQDASLSGIRYNESQPGWFAQIVEDYMKRRAIEIISQSALSIENSFKADNLLVNRKAKKAREGSTPKELIELCPQYIKACKNLIDYNSATG